MKQDKIHIDVIFSMKYPFNESASSLLGWANLHRMKNLVISTEKKDAIIRVPLSVFEKEFGSRPRIGSSYPIPSGAGAFLTKIVVKEITGS